MPYSNVHRTARISPMKARLVADMVRGKPADEALTILEMSKKRGAVFFRKALIAAMANADQAEVDQRHLVVVDARADSGPTMKRFRPKDRGRAHPYGKRTSHITVAVDADTTIA